MNARDRRPELSNIEVEYCQLRDHSAPFLLFGIWVHVHRTCHAAAALVQRKDTAQGATLRQDCEYKIGHERRRLSRPN